MSKTDDEYKSALAGKKIPILTLDNKWHQLFTQAQPNKRIKRLEDKLNELIKRQGKAVTETKELNKLKKRLMKEIMDNAAGASMENDPRAQKRMEESKRLINECNEKIEGYKEELLTLPEEIDRVNYELMLATMEVCYDRLKANENEIEQISRWVAVVRNELKERLVRKQDMETMNQMLYSYMHDIFGADVINLFDTKYQVKAAKDAEAQSDRQ